MAGLPWYAHDIEAYNRKTRGLTMEQDGAYRRLLDHYYDSEQPLPVPLAEVFRIARATTKGEQRSVTHVLNAFFVLEDDGWHNRRADEELGKRQAISQNRSKAGTASAAKRKHKRNTCSTHDGTRVDTYYTTQSSEETIVSSSDNPRKRGAKPKTMLPEQFPLEANLRWALEYWADHQRPDLRELIAEQSQAFRDYHTAHNTRSADWDASWRTWAMNAVDFKRKANGRAEKSNPHDTFLAGGLAALDKFKAA